MSGGQIIWHDCHQILLYYHITNRALNENKQQAITFNSENKLTLPPFIWTMITRKLFLTSMCSFVLLQIFKSNKTDHLPLLLVKKLVFLTFLTNRRWLLGGKRPRATKLINSLWSWRKMGTFRNKVCICSSSRTIVRSRYIDFQLQIDGRRPYDKEDDLWHKNPFYSRYSLQFSPKDSLFQVDISYNAVTAQLSVSTNLNALAPLVAIMPNYLSSSHSTSAKF